ncbi:unnamed protein product, partial [Symbiodinium sp. KB8]
MLLRVMDGDAGAEEGQPIDEHADDVDYGHAAFYSGYDDDLDGDEAEVEDEDDGDVGFSASLPVLQVLLCVYLMFREVRKYLTLKVVMLPCAGTADALAGVWYSRYAVGYMLHFILGHFDNERAEGCNVVSSLFSDLGRFLCFVLVVSISMK